MPDYKCLDCGEEFEWKTTCIVHHIETKHNDFELIATDVKMEVKS